MHPKSKQIQLPKEQTPKKDQKNLTKVYSWLLGFRVFRLFISGAEVPIIAAFAANAFCAWFIAPELSPDMDDIGRVKLVWIFQTFQILFAACCFWWFTKGIDWYWRWGSRKTKDTWWYLLVTTDSWSPIAWLRIITVPGWATVLRLHCEGFQLYLSVDEDDLWTSLLGSFLSLPSKLLHKKTLAKTFIQYDSQSVNTRFFPKFEQLLEVDCKDYIYTKVKVDGKQWTSQ